MSVRVSFVERFGERQARAMETAAEMHTNGIHDKRGSDEFKWAVAICIGYECFTRDRFREYHGINIPVDELKQWIKSDGQLATHDGDFDYLSAMTGHYNEYIPEPELLAPSVPLVESENETIA